MSSRMNCMNPEVNNRSLCDKQHHWLGGLWMTDGDTFFCDLCKRQSRGTLQVHIVREGQSRKGSKWVALKEVGLCSV